MGRATGPGQALAGAGQLAAHRRARLAPRQLHEPVVEPRGDLAPVAQQADRPGPDVVDGMVEELQRQVVGEPAADVQGPEGLEREPVVLLVAHHLRQARADGRVAPLHEDAAGLARVPGVGVLQQVDQLVARRACSSGHLPSARGFVPSGTTRQMRPVSRLGMYHLLRSLGSVWLML